MTEKDNRFYKHLRKCISKIDEFGEMTISPSMYPNFIAPFVPFRSTIFGCTFDCVPDCIIQTDGSLCVGLIDFISFFDDYDSVFQFQYGSIKRRCENTIFQQKQRLISQCFC